MYFLYFFVSFSNVCSFFLSFFFYVYYVFSVFFVSLSNVCSFFHCFSMLLFSRVCRECLLHIKIK